MNAVEFTIELTESGKLQIPAEAAAQLPTTGRARVIILTDDRGEDGEWRSATYAQFLREDPPEDAVYDCLR
jgi:hypothetical protein